MGQYWRKIDQGEVRRMTRMMVAIVNDGERSAVKREGGDGDMQVDSLRAFLELETREDEPVFDVAVVSNTEEALAWASEAGRKGAIIYVAQGKLSEAQKVAKEHPTIRVVLITALVLEEGELAIVPKDNITEAISGALLG
jgi:hypothetical protein